MSNMAGSSMEALLSTLVTNTLMKKLNMDYSYFGLVFAVVYNAIEFIRAEFDLREWIMAINIYHWILFGTLYLIYMNREYIITMFPKLVPRKFFETNHDNIKIRIFDLDKIKTLLRYMKYFPEHFDSNYNVDVGDQQIQAQLLIDGSLPNNGMKLMEYMGFQIPSADTRIIMNDTQIGVKGFIEFKDNQNTVALKGGIGSGDKDAKAQTINLKYCEITIFKKDLPERFDYLAEISKTVYQKEKDWVKLRFLKFFENKQQGMCGGLYSKLHCSIMYEGLKGTLEEKEKQFISSFFHPHRDYLWSYIKKIVREPEFFRIHGQAPRINLLLHGPPGSGKSTFAYRIAMATNRHVFSIDLREFRNKKDVYSVMSSPQFGGSSSDIGTPNQCVFILEEFDVSVKYLHNQERKYDRRMSRWLNRINRAEEIEQKEKQTKQEGNIVPNLYEPIEDEIMKATNNFLIQNDSIGKKKESVYEEEEPDFSEFCLKDLLEIFQGAVPTEGSIIIATTNDYEGIRQLCPALFRPGRLTPVYFGYLDKKSLQELSNYYFSRPLEISLPEQIPIPTSQIIELALEAAMQQNKDPFEHFQNGIVYLLK